MGLTLVAVVGGFGRSSGTLGIVLVIAMIGLRMWAMRRRGGGGRGPFGGGRGPFGGGQGPFGGGQGPFGGGQGPTGGGGGF